MTPRTAAWSAVTVLALLSSGPAPAGTPAPGGELPEVVWNDPPGDEVVDLLFFHETRPVLLRLHVWVDGKSYRLTWADFVAGLHRFLDGNHDGRLTTKELGDTNNWQQVFQSPFGNGAPIGSAPRPKVDANPEDGVISLEELTSFLRPMAGAFVLLTGPGPDERETTLFQKLDRDGDGALSRAELTRAAESLRGTDADDDETIAARELRPYRNPFFGGQVVGGTASSPENAPFIVLEPDTPRQPLVDRLLKQYDNGGPRGDAPAGDKVLSPAEIGLTPSAFRRADANRDGGLGAGELGRLAEAMTPFCELTIRFARREGVARVVVGAGDGPAAPPPDDARTIHGGALELVLGNTRVELTADLAKGKLRGFFLQQFKEADADNNKVLEEKELQNNFLQQYIKTMDRNGDGKLRETELIAFLDQQEEAMFSRTLLKVSDLGHAPFEALDRDRDDRLDRRELRDAARQLLGEGSIPEGGGRVALDEVPRHYQLAIGRGTPTTNNLFEIGGAEPGPKAAVPLPGRKEPPAWFTRMDRNNDGDLSPREFLGPLKMFSRIDSNGDGLISPDEAWKAE